jgi:small conductance mechanosensitive channel
VPSWFIFYAVECGASCSTKPPPPFTTHHDPADIPGVKTNVSTLSVRRVFWLVVPIAILATVLVHQALAQDAATIAQLEKALAPALEAPTTQPTTQVAAANAQLQTGIMEVLKGQQKLTLDQAMRADYWGSVVKELTLWGIGYIPKIIVAFILFGIFYVIYRIVRKVLMTSMKAAGLDESIRDMLARVVKVLILGFGIVIAGNQIGIEIAALLTGVSIIGLAVGFAAQESISNFIAGVMIFLDKPFKVGDWINVDGHLGQVKRVTFRSTRMVDLDGDVVIFPNTAMLNRKLVNKTENPITRVNVAIPVKSETNIDEARRVLMDVIHRDSRIEANPAPEMIVKSVGMADMMLEVHFWIREERYEDAMTFEYVELVKKTLDGAGITRAKAA